MTFIGTTNKGRYEKGSMTQDHYNCLQLKVLLRNKYLSKYKNGFSLVEPFMGNKELFNRVYQKHKITNHLKMDIEPLSSDIIKADANIYPIGKKLTYDVYDLDHHKLEVLQTFSKWVAALDVPKSVFFLTFGVMPFVRKTFVKRKTVLFNGNEDKIQLNYSLVKKLPTEYIIDAAKKNGYEVVDLTSIKYKNIVRYYAFELIKI